MVFAYLAARYSRREELCTYANDLRTMGVQITSRWLNGAHHATDEELMLPGREQLRKRFALEDWEDLLAADLLIAFTDPLRSATSRGGRHVEFGMALGMGKRILVVGPLENVFYCLPWVEVVPDWSVALLRLRWAASYQAALISPEGT